MLGRGELELEGAGPEELGVDHGVGEGVEAPGALHGGAGMEGWIGFEKVGTL